MPKFSIEHNSSIPAEKAITTIKNFFETDKDLQKFDSKIQCQINTSEGTAKVSGSQFKAEVAIKPNGPGSTIKVTVDLPLLLTPFKGKVEETIKHKLGKYLA